MSKKNNPICMSCGSSVAEDHIGIRCIQNHDICSSCCPKFVETIFLDPLSSIPVRCPDCHQEVPSLSFERQLNQDQLEIYNLYMIQHKLDPTEQTKRCPHCQYYEIWLKSSTSYFFYCKGNKCKKITCVICFKDVNLPKTHNHSDYPDIESLVIRDEAISELEEEEYEKSLQDPEGVYYHFGCVELKDLKKTIDSAIKDAERRRCPNCKLAGRKDNSCTHMTCPKCLTMWCYFCGLSEAQCEKDNSGVTIFDHNVGWQYNSKRCPMYFSEISEFDERWPEDDEECLTRFHNILLKRALKEKIDELGFENYQKLMKQFPSIRNCGVELSELNEAAVNEDIIKRVSKEEFESMID